MSEPKYAYRLPPCPDYELEAMESWLEAMAAKGLFLSSEGSFAGFTIFEKQPPRPVRYRLQPFTRRETLFSEGGPEEAAVELAAEFGWELVTTRGMYAVYRADDPNAPEPDTDPAVQAMNLTSRIRRCRRELIGDIVLLAAVVALVLWDGALTFLLNAGQWYLLCLTGVWLTALGLTAAELRHLTRLRRRLLSGDAMQRQKDLSRRRWLHYGKLAAAVLLVIGFYVTAFSSNIFGWTHGRWQSAEGASLPFADMTALAGGGSFEASTMTDRPWHYASRSTLLAEEQIEFHQWGEVTQQGESVLGGSLEVSYTAMRSEGLARQLFDELCRDGEKSRHFSGFTPVELEGADEAVAFTSVFPVLLLRDGNRVLRVEFAQYGASSELTQQQWHEKTAAAFCG